MLTIDDSNRPRGPLDFNEDTFIRDYNITYAILAEATDRTIARMKELQNQ